MGTSRGVRRWAQVPQTVAEPDLHAGPPPHGSRAHPPPRHRTVFSWHWATQIEAKTDESKQKSRSSSD